MTPKQIEKEIANITADPKSAYWDKNHPHHAARSTRSFGITRKENC